MANLDDYEKNAAQDDLGQKAWDKGKAKAKGTVKKNAKKAAKKGAKKAADKLGLAALKKAATKGIKMAVKAIMHALRAALQAAVSFLMSNPVGWVILVILVIAVIAIAKNAEKGKYDHLMEDAIEEEDGSLTEDGVAILMGNCPETVSEGALKEINVDAVTETNAKMIYAVFHKYGLTDKQIAGMLGNIFAESGIDTTSVEGIYDEPYQIGPRKQAAMADLSAHVTDYIWPKYEEKGYHIRKHGYEGGDGNYYCGLGYPQWTGPAAKALMDFSKSTGRDWWACDFQTAYMLSDAHYRPGFFAQWKENPQDDLFECERHFAANYEGNESMAVDVRQEAAQMWYEKIGGWEVDEAYANSIIKLSQSMGAAANDTAVGESAAICAEMSGEVGPYDNSSIASAAASYAYPTKDGGKGNNGTPLYVRVHDNVFPGDTIYQSCDRSIACAIRWSGSDDDFPSGDSTGMCSAMWGMTQFWPRMARRRLRTRIP